METNLEKLSNFLHSKYGVQVIINDAVIDGIEIAELVNRNILINKQSRGEAEILFVIAHLFGHMVQFSHYENYQYLVEKVAEPKPLRLSTDFRKSFYEYEVEAYSIGKGLMEIALGPEIVAILDEKYQIYLDTDFLSYWDYLTTGKQASVAEFNTLLLHNYSNWKGNYPNQLPTILPPDTIVFSLMSTKVY